MFGLTPEQLTTITGATGIISAVIAMIGLPALVLGWHNHLVKRLDDNAVIRERFATALSAPSLREFYATSLEWGLERLERWMGAYRDLVRGYGWCFAVAMAYAAAFILLPWGLAGRGTGFSDWILVPDTLQPWWQRGAALLALATTGIIIFLTLRHEQAIDAWFGEKLRALLERLGLRSDERAARLAQGLVGFVFFLSILFNIRWALGFEFTAGYVAVAVLTLARIIHQPEFGAGGRDISRWDRVGFGC